ncbi:uncharacterized protein LOC128042423 [Gossypium raimondii]|uniref:uncharacterized protein LOC128042423 n=1 Tax=Gossypium raimondii TaxID=29730 RepID=UPI00227C40C4|nr:uncharacterized protein LOC128042423 [Gossypium raimondii]
MLTSFISLSLIVLQSYFKDPKEVGDRPHYQLQLLVMDPERASTDEVESNAPIPAEGTVPSDVNVSERPASDRQGGGAREAFLQAMTDWFAEFVRTNPAIRPPPPQESQVPHVASHCGIVIGETTVDKIRKQGNLKNLGYQR